MEKKQHIQCQISKYSKKGHGVAVLDQKKEITVIASAIGDHVVAEVFKKKRKDLIGKIVELVSPSKDRVDPVCAHIHECGGCSFQHIQYEKQLAYKQNIVEEFYPDQMILPIIGSELFRYRNKMEFSFSQDKEENHYLGLVLPYSKGRVANINECHLSEKWLSDVLCSVRIWWKNRKLKAYNCIHNTGTLITFTLRSAKYTNKKMIMLMISGDPMYGMKQQDIDSFKEAVLSVFDKDLHEQVSIFLLVKQMIKGQTTQIFEMHLHGPVSLEEKLQVFDQTFLFEISPQAFFQPNVKQAQKIYERAIELAKLSKDDVVFDLYSGVGSIGICMAKRVKQVIGIEVNAYSVLDAKENLRLNAIDNYTLVQGEVEDNFLRIEKEIQDNKVVIVDPPRTGLGIKMVKTLLEANLSKIIYISCNPHTQKIDVDMLKEKFVITAIQPVDQFPHTPHFENIIVLEKIT